MRACQRFLVLITVTRLVQRRGQKRRQVFREPTAGVARLALLEAGVQRRLALVRRVIALRLGHVPSSTCLSSGAAYADCRNASAAAVALL